MSILQTFFFREHTLLKKKQKLFSKQNSDVKKTQFKKCQIILIMFVGGGISHWKVKKNFVSFFEREEKNCCCYCVRVFVHCVFDFFYFFYFEALSPSTLPQDRFGLLFAFCFFFFFFFCTITSSSPLASFVWRKLKSVSLSVEVGLNMNICTYSCRNREWSIGWVCL